MPIVVKLPDAARTDLALLERLAVPGARGPVMLGQRRRRWRSTAARRMIDRYDRARNVNFEIELNGAAARRRAGAGAGAAEPCRTCRRACSVAEVGDAEAMAELFASFGLAMLTGVLCIYIVLVLLFKDFLQPVTILARAAAVARRRLRRRC